MVKTIWWYWKETLSNLNGKRQKIIDEWWIISSS